MSKYHTWDNIMKNNKITSIQDPIIEMDIDKNEFNIINFKILSEIQGNNNNIESYIDYYFTVNPLKPYVLSFKSEKEKNEFYNIGLKNNSVLNLKQIHEGEN